MKKQPTPNDFIVFGILFLLLGFSMFFFLLSIQDQKKNLLVISSYLKELKQNITIHSESNTKNTYHLVTNQNVVIDIIVDSTNYKVMETNITGEEQNILKIFPILAKINDKHLNSQELKKMEQQLQDMKNKEQKGEYAVTSYNKRTIYYARYKGNDTIYQIKRVLKK